MSEFLRIQRHNRKILKRILGKGNGNKWNKCHICFRALINKDL